MVIGSVKLQEFLNAQPPSQPKLQPIHLTIICRMIVPAKVNQTMQNKLRDFLFEGQSVLSRLPRRLLH